MRRSVGLKREDASKKKIIPLSAFERDKVKNNNNNNGAARKAETREDKQSRGGRKADGEDEEALRSVSLETGREE